MACLYGFLLIDPLPGIVDRPPVEEGVRANQLGIGRESAATLDEQVLEFINLRWDQVEVDWAVFSADEMKGGRVFRAPLSPAAKGIIEAQPKVGAHVFTVSGRHGISNWSDEKKVLEAKVAEKLKRRVENWRLHDLRRTLGNGLARLGYPLEVRKRVLDHKPDSRDVTAAVYTWHSFDGEAMRAACAWAAHVAKLVGKVE